MIEALRIPARRTLFGFALLLSLLSGCGEQPQDSAEGKSQATPPILQQIQPPSPERPQRQDEPGTSARTGGGKTRPAGTGGGDFDFYVLSLSWSPTWCAENDPGGKTMQCDGRRDYRFVVHGLWPQNEKGFPAFCRSQDSDRVPDALGRSLFDIIPSMGLIGHQWRKHGTCSGLSQRDYFALLRQARERIRIPEVLEKADARRRMSPGDVEAALSAANPGLSPQSVAVTCDNGKLDEIRICLTRGLDFRPCGEVDRGGCRARDITIPSPSGKAFN
jgi:ribonuclease T2